MLWTGLVPAAFGIVRGKGLAVVPGGVVSIREGEPPMAVGKGMQLSELSEEGSCAQWLVAPLPD